MNKKIFLILGLVAALLMGCESDNDGWVYLGDGPKNLAEIPYRIINHTGTNPLPPTNNDLLNLTLSLQSGMGKGTFVYIPIYNCYAPKVRGGVPTVQCESKSSGDVMVGGGDNIREILLHLREDGKRAAIKAKVLGLYSDTPVVWIDDSTARRVEK